MNLQFLPLIAVVISAPAAAQSIINLDSFSNDGASTVQPVSTAPAAASLEACLSDPAECQNGAHKSSTEFSLNDVINLGIVDRESVAQNVSTNASPAAAATDPLPSVDMEILFDYNADTVRGDQIAQLVELAGILKSEKFNNYRFLFMGHSDATGSATYNMDLSARRAESVAQLVRGLAGLGSDRTLSTGQGFTNLKTPHDPFGEQNRRVQLLLVPF
jgi:outer membrane protein OmpA-like peptidoglycan-associated protein